MSLFFPPPACIGRPLIPAFSGDFQGEAWQGASRAMPGRPNGTRLAGLPSLALHPCLDLYVFRVLSNSDRAPVFLFVFCTCLDQAGARFGLGLARSFLCLLRLSRAWRPSSLESVGPVQTFGFQVEAWLDASNPEQMDPSGLVPVGLGKKLEKTLRPGGPGPWEALIWFTKKSPSDKVRRFYGFSTPRSCACEFEHHWFLIRIRTKQT